MLDAKRIQSLPQIPPPVLTLYLDTNPANPRNQGHPSGARIWLKSRAKVLLERAPQAERKLFRGQVERVESHLRNRASRERGVVLLAGPRTWEFVQLQVDVEDELHWGRPSLTQLLWLLDEHQPCGVVLVDRSGARFFRHWLGELEEQEAAAFRVDTSKWRRKDLKPPSHPGIQKTRGSQRDVFEQRVEAQYAKFYRETAGRIVEWAGREKLAPVFVAGPNEVVEPVWAELPRAFAEGAALVKGDFGKLSLADLQARLEPEIAKWKRAHELEVVTKLLANPNGTRAVVGLDEALRKVQEGAARALVVARGLGGKLRQCAKCGWVDRSADRTCPACGGERRVVALRAIVPELARRFNVPVEVVAGDAAQRLREAGGIGVWLR
jgi:hypothetical protein